jgi:predicted ABC-type ATPase
MRVAGRVMDGGHTVPIEKIISRYRRSLANLPVAVALADRVYIYDNSVEDVEARLCARTLDGHLRKLYGELPSWVDAATRDLPRHPQFVDTRAA